jgi:ATP-grasp domain
MAQPDRLVVLIDGKYGTLPPGEIAACVDGLAELHFLVDVAEPGVLTVARSLAPTTQADFSDRDACLDAVRRMGASVVATFADPMCPLVAWLSARLNGDADTDALWGRKDVQRQRLRAAGLSGVMSNRVSDGVALRNFARQAGFPVVVKPTGGCASREVWLLRQEADVDAFLARSGSGPRQELDDVFAEQFIVGEPWAGPHRADYVSAELFRPGGGTGAAALRFVTDRLPSAWPFRETGLVLPSVIGPERQRLLLTTAERALDAVGAHQGVFHVEIKTKSPVPEIIELNGRLGGFVARLVRYSTGENLGRLALSCILGHTQELTLSWDRCAQVLLFQAPPAAVAVTSAPTRREIRRMPGVVAVDDVSPEGTAVDWRHGTNRAVAWVWLTGDGHDELHERLVHLTGFLSDSFTFVDADGREVRDSEWLERVSKSPALENT